MGKSKKDLRSRKPRRLTRKKIMLQGGRWISGPNGKPIWVPDESGYGESYSGNNNSYSVPLNYFPTLNDERTRDNINKNLARLNAENNENRSYASLQEKQAAEKKDDEAAMNRIRAMQQEAFEVARSRNLPPSYPRNPSPPPSYQERNGSPPPSYNSIDEERKQAQIDLIIRKTSQHKKKERAAMLQNMTLKQIHAWIREKNEKRNNEYHDAEEGPDEFYDAQEGDEFYDALSGGVKRRFVKRRSIKKKKKRQIIKIK